MGRLLLIVFATFNAALLRGQSIKELAQTLDQHLEIFSDLGPWDEARSYDSLSPLPQNLLRDYKSGDSVEAFSLIEGHSWMMDSLFSALFQHPDMPKYRPDELIKSRTPLKSRDNRWFQYCFDARTGGSYRSRNCYFYYADPDGASTGLRNANTGAMEGIWNPDGYDAIIDFPPDSFGQPRYFLHSAVMGCNSCISEAVELIRYESQGQFVTEFAYEVNDRGWGGIMNLDLQGDTVLSIAYGKSDLNEGCGMGEGYDESHPQVKRYLEEYGFYPEFCRFRYRWQEGAFRLTAEEHFYGEEAEAESRKPYE